MDVVHVISLMIQIIAVLLILAPNIIDTLWSWWEILEGYDECKIYFLLV